jgi:hypothetical protein
MVTSVKWHSSSFTSKRANWNANCLRTQSIRLRQGNENSQDLQSPYLASDLQKTVDFPECDWTEKACFFALSRTREMYFFGFLAIPARALTPVMS